MVEHGVTFGQLLAIVYGCGGTRKLMMMAMFDPYTSFDKCVNVWMSIIKHKGHMKL
jgi:hypothetical protein